MSKNYKPPFHGNDPAFHSGYKLRGSEWTYEYDAVTASLTLVVNSGNTSNCHSLVEVTANSPTITLPSSTLPEPLYGYFFVIKNSGNGTVTLAATAGQTIDGETTQSITSKASVTVVSNGVNWILI